MLLTNEVWNIDCGSAVFDADLQGEIELAPTAQPRFRNTFIDNRAAMLFEFRGGNCSGAYYASIRQAFFFDPRLIVAGGILTTASPDSHLFLRFAHPEGVQQLAEFGTAFEDFLASRPAFTEPPAFGPTFAIEAAMPQQIGVLARLNDAIEAARLCVTEAEFGIGYCFGRRGNSGTTLSEPFTSARFTVTGFTSDAEARLSAILAKKDLCCKLSRRN